MVASQRNLWHQMVALCDWHHNQRVSHELGGQGPWCVATANSTREYSQTWDHGKWFGRNVDTTEHMKPTKIVGTSTKFITLPYHWGQLPREMSHYELFSIYLSVLDTFSAVFIFVLVITLKYNLIYLHREILKNLTWKRFRILVFTVCCIFFFTVI